MKAAWRKGIVRELTQMRDGEPAASAWKKRQAVLAMMSTAVGMAVAFPLGLLHLVVGPTFLGFAELALALVFGVNLLVLR